jgi:hypothetical protein
MSKNYETGMSRRDALVALGALALSTRAGISMAQEEVAATKGIALQLYTLREPAKKDLAGTLKKCAIWDGSMCSGAVCPIFLRKKFVQPLTRRN